MLPDIKSRFSRETLDKININAKRMIASFDMNKYFKLMKIEDNNGSIYGVAAFDQKTKKIETTNQKSLNLVYQSAVRQAADAGSVSIIKSPEGFKNLLQEKYLYIYAVRKTLTAMVLDADKTGERQKEVNGKWEPAISDKTILEKIYKMPYDKIEYACKNNSKAAEDITYIKNILRDPSTIALLEVGLAKEGKKISSLKIDASDKKNGRISIFAQPLQDLQTHITAT